MTGSTVVHSEVRSSMLSSARIAFTQQYGESPPSLFHECLPHDQALFLSQQDKSHPCSSGALLLGSLGFHARMRPAKYIGSCQARHRCRRPLLAVQGC